MISKIKKEIEKKVKFKVPQRWIERIIEAILSSSNYWEILKLSHLPCVLVSETIKIFQKKNFLKIENNEIFLTEKGEKLAQKLSLSKIKKFPCKFCQGSGKEIEKFKNLLVFFKNEIKNAPLPQEIYDQARVKEESCLLRFIFALEKGDVEGKEIIVLGAEDDYLGFLLALSRKPKRVVVLDIDKRIIEFDKKMAKKHRIPLEAFVFDLRKKLPKKFLKKFDTFFSAPLETKKAIKGFLLKGVSALKRAGCAGYFDFSFADTTFYKWHYLQKLLLERKILITDIISDFNEYLLWDYHEKTPAQKMAPVKKTPDINWFITSWWRIETLPNFKGENKEIKGKDFLTDKEAVTNVF